MVGQVAKTFAAIVSPSRAWEGFEHGRCQAQRGGDAGGQRSPARAHAKVVEAREENAPVPPESVALEARGRLLKPQKEPERRSAARGRYVMETLRSGVVTLASAISIKSASCMEPKERACATGEEPCST